MTTGSHSSHPWLRQVIRRHGVAWSVTFATLLSVVYSVTVGTLLNLWLKGGVIWMDEAYFVIIPALIAPFVTYSFIQLAHQLDAAERHLRLLATEDSLTGVSTRRHFMDMAEGEWARARRNGRPVSLLMMDVDHFKHINDSQGHAVGDQVLGLIGELARCSCREVDLVGRYGGEEFVFLLPETSAATALVGAERLRSVIEKKVSHNMTLEQLVTVSIGVATATRVAKDASLVALIDQADAALYDAKHAGRNCVRLYEARDLRAEAG